MGEPRLDIYRSLNALAESVIGLLKTEEIRRRGPWKGSKTSSSRPSSGLPGITAVAGSNRSAYVSPAEFEKACHDRQAASVGMAVLT